MKLLTKKILKEIPKLNETENVPLDEKIVHVKYFFPAGRMTFFAMEYDPKEELFFGYILSPITPEFDELCYMTLNQLKEAIPTPIQINNTKTVVPMNWERDLYFTKKTYKEIKDKNFNV